MCAFPGLVGAMYIMCNEATGTFHSPAFLDNFVSFHTPGKRPDPSRFLESVP